MSKIEIKGVNKYYGKAHILKNLDLLIEDGDFMTLLGPSGCGKTTTLRVISGLENPQTGTIAVDNNEVVNAAELSFLPPAKRGLDLVFQSYALWPHMTVFDNVAFGLTLKKQPREEIEKKVDNALERMRILQYRDRYPNELSGGQQQRVAIARAIVSETRILLLDEPLSNLDAKLRVEMRSELKRLHKELGTTVVYVTHDQVEALTMSTKVAVFFEGVLVQCNKPMEVYRNPVDIRVADFIGNPKINFIDGDLLASGDIVSVNCPLGQIDFKNAEHRKKLLVNKGVTIDEASNKVTLAVRPEHIKVYEASETVSGDILLEAKVYSTLPAGSETLINIEANGISLMAKCIGQREYGLDQEVRIGISNKDINLYDKSTGHILLAVDN